MRSRCLHGLAAASAFGLVSPAVRAQVEQNVTPPPTAARRAEPPGSRVGLGTALGSRVGVSLDVNGEPSSSEAGASINGGVLVTYDQRVTPWFSLGASGRMMSWDSERTIALGYGRFFLELDLVPRLRQTLSLRRPLLDAYVSFPFGLTWPNAGDRPERAVREDWELYTGFNLGPAVGLEAWGKHWGGYVELGYFVRIFSADVTHTPVADPTAAVGERLDYVDHQILFTAGALYGW